MFRVSPHRHRLLGAMIRLEAGGGAALNLMPAEARTIALALDAVREGRSTEGRISLSPLGDDGHFEALAEPDGLRIGADLLDWEAARTLAAALTKAAEA